MSLTETPAIPNARLRAAIGKTALKSAFAAVAMGVLGAGQAQAVVVNVNGQNWNVTTFTGTFNDNISKFNTAANGGVMPWWRGGISPSLASTAQSFAMAVGLSFGLPNNINGSALGPIFSYGAPTTGSNPFLTVVAEDGDDGYGLFCEGCNPISRNEIATWAQAELVLAVPGPLPALGAAAAFGFSRKLRQRIKVSKVVGASATAV
jgi:hypothetical protein